MERSRRVRGPGLRGRGLGERGLALLVLLLAACASAPLQQPPDDYGYANERLGVALDLGAEGAAHAGWKAYTQRAGAPEAFRSLLPPEKGPDDSPLLVGADASQQAFVRLLVEPAVGLDAESYFAALHAAIAGEVQPREARLSRERDSVRWRYSVQSGVGLTTFHETLVVRDGLAFRLGFWTLDGLLPRYEEEFERIAATLLLRGEGGWTAPWRGLEATLEEGAFDQLAFADPPGPGEAACPGGAQNLLWEVSTERGRMTLFGSLHFGHPDFYPLADPVESAFAEAERLVVEVDSTQPGFQRRMAALVEEKGQYPPGRTIRDEVSPRVYERLDAELAELGLPTERFVHLEPWTVSIVLMAFKFQSMGYGADAGVEHYLLARADDRPIVALETAEEQIALLDSLDGELFLAYTLLSLRTFESETAEMIRAWRCGEAAALERLLLDESGALLPGVSDVMERIFDERNQRMVESLEGLLEQGGSHFVVVGAGHLLGDEGIPALLAERGWPVERR